MVFRFRKFAPIDRETPIIEALVGDRTVFDVTKSDDGKWELGFHEGASGLMVELGIFERAIAEAKLQYERAV